MRKRIISLAIAICLTLCLLALSQAETFEADLILPEGVSVMSGHGSFHLSPDGIKGEEYYINLGYDGYLSKPVDGKILERIISKHLPDEIKD